MKWTWKTKTYEEVRDAITSSHSYRAALLKLGLKAAGGNYESLKRAIRDHNFDTLSNLRLLCPNCHALTPNYRGKNKGNYS